MRPSDCRYAVYTCGLHAEALQMRDKMLSFRESKNLGDTWIAAAICVMKVRWCVLSNNGIRANKNLRPPLLYSARVTRFAWFMVSITSCPSLGKNTSIP